MAIWNPSEHSEEENLRWCWLRAIEWGRWPVFISQPIYPLFLLIVPWFYLTSSILVINILWSYLIKYRHINISLAAFGPLFVKLKWITCPLMAVYFYYHGEKLTAALALFWPILIFVIGAFPFTKTGLIQKMFINKLSIEENVVMGGFGSAVAEWPQTQGYAGAELRTPLKNLPDTKANSEGMVSRVGLETKPEGFRTKSYTPVNATNLGEKIFATCVLEAEKTFLQDIFDKYKDKPEFKKEAFERQKFVFLSENIEVAIVVTCEKRPEFTEVLPAFRKSVINEMLKRSWFRKDLIDDILDDNILKGQSEEIKTVLYNMESNTLINEELSEAGKELMDLVFTDQDKDRVFPFRWAQKWLKCVGVEESNPTALLKFSDYWIYNMQQYQILFQSMDLSESPIIKS